MAKKIFIVAGDPSGDIHGARLIKELKILMPEASFSGIGGAKMLEEGFNSIIPLESISIVGFWEVAKKYNFFKNLIKKCKEIIINGQYDLFIPIDYPGFNIKLSEELQGSSTNIIYYIAPQLWAWGKGRAAKLKNSISKLLCVFPFEEEYFNNFGINTYFVGHPLLDDPEFEINSIPTNKNNQIAIFAGSRKQEILRHLPLIDDIITILKSNSNLDIVISKINHIDLEFYKSRLNNWKYCRFEENPRNLMKNSKIGLIKTGTSNLEAALLMMPSVMYYKASYLNYLIGKNLINLKYVSLPNILLNNEVIPEYIQNKANPKLIVNSLLDIINNNEKYSEILEDYSSIRNLLGSSGASKKAAEIIFNSIN